MFLVPSLFCFVSYWVVPSFVRLFTPLAPCTQIRILYASYYASAKCKSGTTVLLVHHPAPWSPWSPWSTLIHLGPQFPECGYTKWSKQDQGGPGVVQGLRQDHGAGWWTRSVQDHRGPLKHFFLMFIVVFLMSQLGRCHFCLKGVMQLFHAGC